MPDSRTAALTVDKGTEVHLNRSEATGSKCTACAGSGTRTRCASSLLLTSSCALRFTCSNPEEVFTAEIIRHIECPSKICRHAVVPTDFQPLFVFNRTFSWSMRAHVRTPFHVNFGRTGLSQILPTKSCPNANTYSLVAAERTSTFHLGSFCQNGPISGIIILNGGRVSIRVPGGNRLEGKPFEVLWAKDIKSPAVIHVQLPEEVASSEFFSPNYPNSFYHSDPMMWHFQVPRHYNATVKLLSYTEPRCLTGQPEVAYGQNGTLTVKKLGDRQPDKVHGAFSLGLRSCQVDMKQPNTSGLSLHFKVSTVKMNQSVLCNVDLRDEDRVTLLIEKKDPRSSCVLKLDDKTQNAIIAHPQKMSYLFFGDCLDGDLLMTVNKTIGCQQWKDCPKSLQLSVPTLERCLPKALHRVFWNVYGPVHSTVALSGGFRQSLPNKPCNGSVLFELTDRSGMALGHFCRYGVINNVQFGGNAIITASETTGKFLSQTFQTFFKVSFVKEVREDYVFTAKLKNMTTVFLASPGWPEGMKALSNVSWVVTIPPKMDAHLTFRNISQPKCRSGQTSVTVGMLDAKNLRYTEGKEATNSLVLSESFYINMSNCLPEKGVFSVMSEVTLQKTQNKLLIIILAVVGVLLAVAVLAVVCVVMKKRKKAATCNPKGRAFLPGIEKYPKSSDQQEEDLHIYTDIDETLVYGHLLKTLEVQEKHGTTAVDVYRPFVGPTEPLRDPPEMEGLQVGVYRPFTGSAESSLPTPQTST
ncbi:CUB domain-containing protein 1a [Denticeps clupeoides]|uniref:CUB domain-containing protein 1 n=1 Tax=Denticeps clupeoides TaxID=299321 RepID=A0AAY4AK45_9TELE|nr:CUB domain-containing protein 1 [Denticeps clupeoides]